MNKKLEIRSELLKTMQEKKYSSDTHYKIILHITNCKQRDLAPEALTIVEESQTEEEALEKILNLK